MKSINNYKTTKQNRNERMYNFFKAYEKEVTPAIEKLEKTRIIELSKFYILATLLTAFVIFFIFVGTMARDVASIVLSAVVWLMLYGPVLAGLYYWINRNYQKKVKQDLLQKVLRSIGDIYWIPEKEIIDNKTLEKSKLFRYYQPRINDDTFQGKYKNLSFKISETKIAKGIDEGIYTSYNEFSGVIILIDSNKETKAQTIITTDTKNSKMNPVFFAIGEIIIVGYLVLNGLGPLGFGLILLLILGLILSKKEQGKKMSNMTTEDPEFNKKYDVFTQDQIEGRYLVTTSFMERFKNLHTAFGTTRAKCAFFDNKVMFALSTGKNLFELSEGIFCSLKKPTEQTKVFYEEISAIYDIIDYFKLGEKTGL